MKINRFVYNLRKAIILYFINLLIKIKYCFFKLIVYLKKKFVKF